MAIGIDISHYNDATEPINFDLLRGHVDFVITKVTEGASYVDPTATAHVSETERIGAVPGVYHFARGGDPNLEAGFFIAHCPPLAGAFAVLDWEIANPNPVQWCLTWLSAVRNAIGTRPLLYLNKSTINGYDWSPVINAGFGLWEASYDGNANDFSATGAWPCVAIKQYTDAGSEPGITGAVDLDSFNGDVAQLRQYCVTASPAPTPAPAPAPVPAGNPWDALPSLTYGMMHSNAVARLQSFLARMFPAYASTCGTLPATGNYLDITVKWIAEFQRRTGISGGDGRNVGPQTKAKLWSFGYRG